MAPMGSTPHTTQHPTRQCADWAWAWTWLAMLSISAGLTCVMWLTAAQGSVLTNEPLVATPESALTWDSRSGPPPWLAPRLDDR
jgi:hypothetical protein